ncbi:gamma-taxilin [Spodoptera frugiperda]|uniref:Gamma-taxilin n=1 Tax=Spodoptera frugiperda TaxID=7108 RepID=A0A9R0ERB6_SPOFR|nr:gamma-taxilin [Spodoptera frugiperda]
MEAATEDTQKESTENVQSNNTATESTPTPPLEVKKGKRDDRSRRDDKNVEQFMKSLNSVPTLEEKLSLVCKKYVQTADDNKKMQFYIKQSDKRHAMLLKEKEQLQLEFNKTILVKSKLENLCRELQKQNKAIKEESLLKIREEEERRKETQAKFQNTLTEITAMLQQNNEKNAKLRDDNISMSEKFKSVVQQYQLREQQVDKMAKQMALESQLSDAKMQKASLEHQADKERLLAEMEQVKVTLAQYRAKIMELQGTETSLRSQLAVYTDKYDEFQNALVKSNKMFTGFKEQMEMMSKKIKKLEKESLSWKTRWETSQTALLDMCAERQAATERAAASARQLHHMQSLCRTLQAERTVLLGTLKDNNIERPALPALPPLPPPAPAPVAQQPASNAKVDAMAANCAQLRQSLAHLQTQLNTLTNKQKEESPAPEKVEKPEKSKKSKSKKNKAEKAKAEAEKAAAAKETESNEEVESSETTAKVENVEEIQPSANEDTTDLDTDKVDEKTLENLIQAINNANINLCDLEVVSDEILEVTSQENSEENSEKVEIKEIEAQTVEAKESTSNESPAASPVKESPVKEPSSESGEVANVEVETVIETNINDVNEVLSKFLNEVQEVTAVNGCGDADVTVVETSNEEVSQVNEVKPIPSDA